MATKDKNFIFAHEDEVSIKTNGFTGEVRGRVDYVAHENEYLVRYQDATGKQHEDWIPQSALE